MNSLNTEEVSETQKADTETTTQLYWMTVWDHHTQFPSRVVGTLAARGQEVHVTWVPRVDPAPWNDRKRTTLAEYEDDMNMYHRMLIDAEIETANPLDTYDLDQITALATLAAVTHRLHIPQPDKHRNS